METNVNKTNLVLAAVAAGLLLGCAAVANADPVTKVTVRNAGKEAVKDAPVTFGQVFKKGDIKTGVLVNVAGTPGQADIKRKYDDGSVRFAVISALVPEQA